MTVITKSRFHKFQEWMAAHWPLPAAQKQLASAIRREPLVLRFSGWIIAIAIVVTAGGIYASVFVFPDLFIESDLAGREVTAAELADIKNSYRNLGLQLTAGLAAFFAAVLTWGRLQLSRESHHNEVSGQITERYTRAVDQLGNDDPAVRLGGLYALERIAVDSKQDRPTVAEVLSAYVRHRTTGRGETKAQRTMAMLVDQSELRVPLPTRSVDVRAALSILKKPEGFWEVPVNLSFADLREADLKKVDLKGANLAGADLRMASFQDLALRIKLSRLRHPSRRHRTGPAVGTAEEDPGGPTLSETQLQGAKLAGLNLSGANLRKADLTEADLTETMLAGALLSEATLVEAMLSKAVLQWADLGGANLSGADLIGADLRYALLPMADLSHTLLVGADLTRADLTDANLTGADLTDTDFTDANLTGADLSSTNVRAAIVTSGQLESASLTSPEDA